MRCSAPELDMGAFCLTLGKSRSFNFVNSVSSLIVKRMPLSRPGSCQFTPTAENLHHANPLRSRRSAASASGNAMHVNAIGAVCAAVLLLYPKLGERTPPKLSPFGQALWLARSHCSSDLAQ
jgi:hypothetical protein